MPVAQPLIKLDIDGVKHLVDEMSPEVQQIVAIYNEWNQDLIDAQTKTAQLQAAVQMAHNQLQAQIKKEHEEAQELAESEAAPVAPPLDAKASAESIVAEERRKAALAAEAAAALPDVATEDRFGIDGQHEEG